MKMGPQKCARPILWTRLTRDLKQSQRDRIFEQYAILLPGGKDESFHSPRGIPVVVATCNKLALPSFYDRIARAFENLELEAARIEKAEYARLNRSDVGEYGDESHIAEAAYFKGVDFCIATDAVRQGVVNLLVAGIFHLFEQQTRSLSREMSLPALLPNSLYPWEQLKKVLADKGVDVSQFRSAALLEELHLVANVVKHGDGPSAERLRVLKPELFEDKHSIFRKIRRPLRPLVGEGLRLTEDHFKAYEACLEAFWNELTEALLPIFCRQA